PLPHTIEDAASSIRHSAIQLTVWITIEGSACGIRRVPRDARQLEGLAVVERRVTAAMMDHDRVLGRHLIEVVHVERALVLELRIVEEVSVHPRPRRRLAGLRAELL